MAIGGYVSFLQYRIQMSMSARASGAKVVKEKVVKEKVAKTVKKEKVVKTGKATLKNKNKIESRIPEPEKRIDENRLQLLGWIDESKLDKDIKSIVITSTARKDPHLLCFLDKNLDMIQWYELSSIPEAILILEINIDKIAGNVLSSNPNAINLLEKNKKKINWENLSRNPNAIPLLEKNMKEINWDELSETNQGETNEQLSA